MPKDAPPVDGPCVFTGKEAKQKVLFAKAY
jgi:hypothetical protein